MNSIKNPNSIECIVLAGGLGTRLGMGPKAFVKIGIKTLLEISISNMLDIVSRVVVAVPAESVNKANEILSKEAQVSVIAGGNRRIDTLRLLVENSTSDWLILHDVVHPFTSLRIIQDVIDSAYANGSAAAASPIYEFLYNSIGEKISKPGQALIIQKPIVFRKIDAITGFSEMDKRAIADDLSVLEVLSLAGTITSFVHVSQLNHKITYKSDLDFYSEFYFNQTSI